MMNLNLTVEEILREEHDLFNSGDKEAAHYYNIGVHDLADNLIEILEEKMSEDIWGDQE